MNFYAKTKTNKKGNELGSVTVCKKGYPPLDRAALGSNSRLFRLAAPVVT